VGVVEIADYENGLRGSFEISDFSGIHDKNKYGCGILKVKGIRLQSTYEIKQVEITNRYSCRFSLFSSADNCFDHL
jgi:hypothetical protein